jgi:hypothetical protein
MKKFEKAEMKRLKWLQSGPTAFDLVEGRETLAALEWTRAVGHHARGWTADQNWEFERLSLFGPYVRIRVADEGSEIAHFGRSAVEEPCVARFHGGAQYVWGPLGMIDGMTFGTQVGQPVVDFRPYMRGEDRGANITVHRAVPELPLLLLLGWYVLEMEYREDYGLETGAHHAPAL